MMQKSPALLIAALWFAGLGAAGQFAKVSVSFQELGSIYAVSDAKMGLIVSVVSLLGVLLGMTAGQLVTSIGFRKMLLASLTLGAVLSAVQASFPPYALLLISRIFEGLAHLGIVVAAPTLIGVLATHQSRGFYMALWSTMFSVAFAVMATIAPGVISRWGVDALFMGHAAYMALMAVILFIWLPKGAVAIAPRPSLREILRQHLRTYQSSNEFAPALGWLFYTLTFVSTITLLPRYLDPDVRLILIPILPLASSLTSLTLGAWLMKRMTAVALVQWGFALSGLSVLLIALSPTSVAIYVLLFAMLGLIQSASFAAVPQLNTAADAQARANGAMSQTGNLGNTLGTPVMLIAMGWFDFAGLTGMLIVCYLAGALAHFWLSGKHSPQTI